MMYAMGLIDAPALRFGPHAVGPPVLLAPMASISNPPFRSLCLEMGCGLATTEMVAAAMLARAKRPVRPAFERGTSERVLHVQLFGKDPSDLAQAARRAEAAGADALDFNLGCPARKVVATGAGAALARDVRASARALEAIVKAVRIPVSAKIRSGWDERHLNGPDLARALESAGAAMITIHGRTRDQQFGGRADWTAIRSVVEAVRLPVVGNGDVRTFGDADRMLRETGCAGVMIGRGALGRPWVFRCVALGLDEDPPVVERVAILRDHLRRYVAWTGTERACREMRKHLLWFVRGAAGAAAFRAAASRLSTPEEIDEWLARAADLLGATPPPSRIAAPAGRR